MKKREVLKAVTRERGHAGKVKSSQIATCQEKVPVLRGVTRMDEASDLLPQERAELFAAFMDNSPAIGFVKDADGRFLYYNRLFCQRFAISASEWLGKNVFDLFPAEFAKGYHDADMAVLEAGVPQVLEETSPGPCNTILYWRTHKFPIPQSGARPLLGGLCLDVSSERHTVERLKVLHTALMAANEQLVELSHTDALTGLANRRAFDLCLQNALHQPQPSCLLLVDVDNFKGLNDTYGHLEGDRALKALAVLLKSVCRPEDTVARFGGEEFAVWLKSVQLDEGFEIAQRLREGVEAFAWEKRRITVSVGLTMCQDGANSLDHLIARADEALYRAKREGRNRVCSSDACRSSEKERQAAVIHSSSVCDVFHLQNRSIPERTHPFQHW